MAEFEYDEGQMEELMASSMLLFRRRFLQAIREIRSTLDIERLASLIRQGRIAEALSQAESSAILLANAHSQAYISAADDVTRFISNSVGINVTFDRMNERAVREMQQASLRLVREFTASQRDATRHALQLTLRQGLNPREQARLLVQSIGLTVKQVSAVANYRRLLEQGSSRALDRALRDSRFDQSLSRAVSGDKPLSQSQIDRMVDQYYRRSLASRAETIARTEALGAVHQGADAGFLAAIEQGAIDDELSQVWHTAGDARVRVPSHTFMNGQVRPFGKPFVSGTGNLLMYPGDQNAPAHDVIRCRCVKTTRFTVDVPEQISL